MMELVRCRGLECSLGRKKVLGELDFEMKSGESVALLGSSGSGKTTLLRVIAGLEMADRGEVVIAGNKATGDGRLVIPPHRRNIAMLFQDLALWPNLTVAANVRLGLSGLRLARDEARERAVDALDLCGIAELSDRLPGSLSGGQQQRVALARALAARPKLLLLDEPFGGLDLVTKQEIMRQIVQLRAESGFALVLVTHDPLEVRSLCESAAILETGRIVEHGSLADLCSTARSALGKAFAEAFRSMVEE